jgi:4-amino-4-deoxy-L-arabinose transferase-like glycosyltransferase
MHFNHFGKELMSVHVWRQTQTQSTIVNFYEEDMNILNPRKNDRGNGDGIFRMEFPIMQWLVACLFKLFGNHIIISRIFMFLVGLLSVLGIYRLIKIVFLNEIIALIAAWAFNFSPCFYYYTINPLPDNFALCCGIWGVGLFILWIQKQKTNILVFSVIFLSLATLTKLPFVVYYSVPFTYFGIQLYKQLFTKTTFKQFVLHFIFLLFPLAWYIYVIPHWQGNGIVSGILDNKISIAKYFDLLWYNLISNLPELLLNYGSVIFFVIGFYFIFKKQVYKNYYFLIYLFWSLSVLAYFMFELNMIGKVHDYYLFPFYPILFIIVAYGVKQFIQPNKIWLKYTLAFFLLILPITAHLRMKGRWQADSPGFNKDLLEHKIALRNIVPKNALCIVGNDESHFIFFYFIDKKGWSFDKDEIFKLNIEDCIQKGAKYLYTDSRKIENDENVKPFLKKLITEKGTIRVYELKKNTQFIDEM